MITKKTHLLFRQVCFTLGSNNITHGVQTGRFALQECRSGQCAVCKEAAVFCLMLQGDGLSAGGDDDLMGTHFVAQAQRVDADFLGGTLAILMAANQQNAVFTDFLDLVCQQQRGTAGNIQLLIVVLLHDLDIKSCCRQNRSNIF